MIVFYKTYPWINPETGKEPKTGDEFLYIFFTHKDEPNKTYLCMKPSIHPIKQHPLGFFGFISLFPLTLQEKIGDFLVVFFVIFFCSLFTGSLISFWTYISYYTKEKKWKQQVIKDWKSDKLKYKYSDSILSDFTFKLGGSPIDESKFK